MLYASKSFTVEYPLSDANVCVLGVPFDSTSIAHPLQRYGPALIRNALKHLHYYIPEKKRAFDLRVHDAGDVDVAPGSFEETDRRVRDTVASIVRQNPKALLTVLGGEHSITLPVVRELKPRTIVSFDAHPDLWESHEGVSYSHATWLYHAAKELNCEIVLLGVRATMPEVEKTMKKLGVKTKLPSKLKGPVYVTIDMDSFDPAYAPDTGFPEPNGFTPKEIFELIDRVFASRVIGLDVTEVASDRFGNPTANLAARTLLRCWSNITR
ncbi:MAG: arginase family protein [Candidatus Aenigmatarchaeota archaeon]|nr:MAG: arginase family protein [Candidatus Aenigmarchaeota archaeon]